MRGNGIKPLGSLFQKYANLIAPQATVVTAAVEVVQDVCGFTIDPTTVSYKQGILRFNVSGPQRSEIMLKKGEVLTHLRGRLGVKNAPRDII